MHRQVKLAVLVWLAMSAPALAEGKPAAIVNGEPIPMADFQAALALRPAELFPVSASQEKLLHQEIIELLISDKLMKQFLAKNAPPVDAAELNKQMAALLASLKVQGKTFAEFCKESRQTESQIRSGLANMLQYAAYCRQHTSDEQIRSYFEANRDFFQKTTVRLSHIVIRVSESTPAAERLEAEKRLREIRQQILTGKISFADAAQKFSQCPSAPRGGDIGFVTRKWMVDENVARAAFSMKKGDISDVVASEFGLHLLTVTERNEGPKVEFAAVADDVRDTYTEEMRQKLLLDLRRAAKVQIFVK